LKKKHYLGSQITCQKDLAIPLENSSHDQNKNKITQAIKQQKKFIYAHRKCVQTDEGQPVLMSSSSSSSSSLLLLL
jgi:hypothetical protein